MAAVVNVALPVFAVICAGLIAGRMNLLPAADAAALNRFVFRFAMPAALFTLTATAPPVGGDDLKLAAAFAVAFVTVMTIVYPLARRAFSLTPQEAGAHLLASTFGNAVFLGLPIALAMPGWGPHFVVLMLVEGTAIIAIGSALMRKAEARNPMDLILAPLKNPLVAAMIAGLFFAGAAARAGLALEGPVATFINLLARAAGPTALFSLGLFLATNKTPPVAEFGGRIASVIAAKMAALPALTLLVLSALGVSDPDIVAAAALFTATPVAVGSFVMSSAYGVYVREVAAAVAVSTLLSLATISAVLWVFG